jgi:translation initiation factor IF-2
MSISSTNNKAKNIIKRAPVVAVVGHIDHGKSSLLDYIRKANIVEGEAGGITQHISAYEVNWTANKGSKDEKVSDITFLDTPGHAAFSSMRERGVEIADIAILLVSAEDGAKPQTKESYKAIEKSGLPYIVAINKIDKPGANMDMTKNSLADIGVYLEGWGGDIPFVAISAKVGTGINELLDLIVLQSEMMELEIDMSKEGYGIVLESFVDTKRGISATLIVKGGAIHKGSTIWSADSISPTRIMEDFLGKATLEVPAGRPIKVTGFNRVPEAGRSFFAFDKKRDAEEALEEFIQEKKKVEVQIDYTYSKDFILPLIIKADMAGSLEAVEKEIASIKIEGVKIKIIKKEVGPVMESDVTVANIDKSTALIAFHTSTDRKAMGASLRLNVKINNFDIIYKLSEWLLEYATQAKPKVEVEEVAGVLKVIRVFNRNKTSQVVGGKVEMGLLKNNGSIRITRKDIFIGKGKIVELQSMKQNVQEVQEGTECGLMVDSKYDIAEGDKLEFIIKKTI